MANLIDLNALRRKAIRDTVNDGLIEILFGVMFFFISGALRTSIVGIVVMVIIFGSAPFLRYLKRRITYPRIGYAEFPQGDTGGPGKWVVYWLVLVLIIMAVVLALFGDLSSPVRWYPWTPLFFGLLMLGFLFPLGIMTHLARFYVYGVLFLVTSIYFVMAPVEGKLTTLANYLLVMSGAMLLIGLVNLVRFVLANPVQPQEDYHVESTGG